MSDIGTRYTDSRQRAIEQRMHTIYRAAQAEIIEQLDAHTKRQNAQTRVKLAQVKAGKLSEEEFNKWQAGQMFTGKQWKDKVTSIATTLLTANQQANSIIEGEKRAVFGENATYQSYRLEHDANLDMSFGVYDSATVTRILRDDPTLLKPREIDEEKDIEWNRRNVTHAVAQGIIQGDSIQQIAKRIAKNTASKNEAAMTRYARTAMTSAQNAGRMEVMQEASEMGIQVRKLWIATLDERTRDAHQELDGQTAEINEPFDSMLGPIDYPGDPKADDANIWNCRCTLGYEYKEYPKSNSTRRDNISGEEIEDMTYDEWRERKHPDWKKRETLFKPDNAKEPETQEDSTLEDLFGDLWSGKVTEDELIQKNENHKKETEEERLGFYGIEEKEYPADIRLTDYDNKRLEAIKHYYDNNYKMPKDLAQIHPDELRLAKGDDSMFSMKMSEAERKEQEQRKSAAQEEIDLKKEQGYKGLSKEESYKRWKSLSKELAGADEFEALEQKKFYAVGKEGIQYWQRERKAAEREIMRIDFTVKLYDRLMFSRRSRR